MMLIEIPEVLTLAECDAIRDALSNEAVWRDGGETAAGAAKAVKNNHQAAMTEPAIRGAAKKIENALGENKLFNAATQIEKMGRILFSRYNEGMSYGDHVDAPFIDGVRTDISLTLFLSDPADYDGGALVIKGHGHEDKIRLPAGSAILYPSTYVHEVTTVTRGVRLACVAWIKSRIKKTDHRAMVFELDAAIAKLRQSSAEPALTTQFANVRNNLLREFSD